MKRYLCLIFIVGCLGYQETDEWTLKYVRGQRYPKDFGNPDIGARIDRPCEVYDSYCIRTFLAEHSSCKAQDGPIPDPLYRTQSTLNAAYANMSVIWNNLRYSNLNNSRVEEFYINRATKSLVIAVYFDSINIAASPMYLKFYRRGQEPAIARDFAVIEFTGELLNPERSERFQNIIPSASEKRKERGVSITAVIPYVNALKLENAEIFSYVDSIVSPFLLGAGLAVPLARDPLLAAQYARFFTGISTGIREVFLTEGPFLLATYLQHKLCHFGLKLL